MTYYPNKNEVSSQFDLSIIPKSLQPKSAAHAFLHFSEKQNYESLAEYTEQEFENAISYYKLQHYKWALKKLRTVITCYTFLIAFAPSNYDNLDEFETNRKRCQDMVRHLKNMVFHKPEQYDKPKDMDDIRTKIDKLARKNKANFAHSLGKSSGRKENRRKLNTKPKETNRENILKRERRFTSGRMADLSNTVYSHAKNSLNRNFRSLSNLLKSLVEKLCFKTQSFFVTLRNPLNFDNCSISTDTSSISSLDLIMSNIVGQAVSLHNSDAESERKIKSLAVISLLGDGEKTSKSSKANEDVESVISEKLLKFLDVSDPRLSKNSSRRQIISNNKKHTTQMQSEKKKGIS